MKSPLDCARDSDWMIRIVLIIIIIIVFIILLFLFLFLFLFLIGAQRRSSFSKVSHHLGVYFLRFIGLLYGESGVKAYPEDHVCVCRIAYFMN